MHTQGCTVARAAAALALLLAAGCGGSSAAPGGNPGSSVDAGYLPCAGTLSGLANLDDAGFSCVVALLTAADGGKASLALASAGALPDPVIGLGAVITLAVPPPAGGAPPGTLDAGPDAGPPDAGSFDLSAPTRGTANVDLSDGEAFGLDTTAPLGRGRLTFTFVSDAGVLSGGTRLYAAHGSLDATLPLTFGARPDAGAPDGGPFDAGTTVHLHATF